MKIWVDADACPVIAKEILFRAADRTGTQLTLVANQPMSTPRSENIRSLQVPRGIGRDRRVAPDVARGRARVVGEHLGEGQVADLAGQALHAEHLAGLDCALSCVA